ncbi:MAG: TAT-variant-translocated molybdopterin oxidoreductase [Acidobacteria bacterium]|nr:TAT-variant-translocated molybdopterin oxidoreductase [Acidobacteriota bacterium]
MTKKRELTILTGKANEVAQSSIVNIHAAKTGKEYWRSLEELAETPEFQSYLHREFPENAAEWHDPKGRRNFLKLMGASLALAGLSTACVVQPEEKIIPYVKQPEEIIPGKPLYFATAMALSGVASGLLVESHMGRPTKIEGNPDHPNNQGAAGVFEQASILNLYDPDRSQVVTYIGDILSWSSFLGGLKQALQAQKALQGAGLRILTGAVASPTLANQLKEIKALYPSMKVHHYEPVNNSNAVSGATLAFGEAVEAVYDFSHAKVVLSLDADFLSSHPANLKYIREFVNTRRLQNDNKTMSRFYAVETFPSNTGAKADHRLALRAAEMEAFVRVLAEQVGVEGVKGEGTSVDAKYLDALVADLKANRGASVIIAGREQSPMVHALVYALNNALGNFGATVNFIAPLEPNAVDHTASIRELAGDINAGKVDALVILGGNPVYDAPADLDFKSLIQKVTFTAHLGFYNNETSAYCRWHVPEAHYLEAWSDARALDGTVSIVQPLIEPLYQGKSAHEMLAAFTDRPERASYEIVREYWLSRIETTNNATANPATLNRTLVTGAGAGTATGQLLPAKAATPMTPSASATPPKVNTPAPSTTAPDAGATNPAATTSAAAKTTGAATSSAATTTGAATSSAAAKPTAAAEKLWRKALHDGLIVGTSATPKPVTLKANWAASLADQSANRNPQSAIEVVFRADPNIYDGSFSNNGWLQELPKPLSKLTWGNAAYLSPATAKKLSVANGNVIRLTVEGRSIDAPVWIMPGHANDSITVHFGFGRERVGKVGNKVGFSAYKIRSSKALWFTTDVQVSNTGNHEGMASTQDHWAMEGRALVREATLEEYLHKPDYAKERVDAPSRDLTLYPNFEYTGHKWGMAIDLNNCVGCNACVIACQSENNIAVVGKEQVANGREMQWIRIDRYYKGHQENDAEFAADPEFFFEPVACVHCEEAPCEVVCPVAATTHSAEGTNDMVYNRCVGTRYCANNCPYKVRRFNFLLYQDFVTESLKLQRNPDVSVRSRGVMEKCTYCIQRIQEAKIDAEKDNNRPIKDGDIKTACQQTCPADAIVFGDLNDASSRVAKLHNEPRAFGLLEELNTRPRTHYLAEVRNPNPALKKS